jgi:FkbM family methyltransferase
VDVGANIGLYTVLLASLAGPGGRVVAFEPGAAARSRLHANVAHLAQVTVLPDALGARAGTAVLSRWSGNAGAATLRDSGWPDPIERAPVAVRRLDEVPQVMDAGEIDFLKVDVEGWESEVFAGATRLLESHRIRAALVEVSPAYGPVGYVDDLVEDDAYRGFRVVARPTRSRLRRTLQLQPLPAPAAGSLVSQVSVLFVRRDAACAVSDLVMRAVAS